ncbi:hypothetical protein BHE74_00005197 [Ensete ventricosum]|nr:hypothetical protein BHE74_00005197 [Ensete ventricosum]
MFLHSSRSAVTKRFPPPPPPMPALATVGLLRRQAKKISRGGSGRGTAGGGERGTPRGTKSKRASRIADL